MERARRGVLDAAGGLDRWLAAVMALFVVACAARYIEAHGVDLVLLAAAVLLAGYGLHVLRDDATGTTAMLTVLILVAIWAALTVVAPSFAWVAVPLSFGVLRAVPWPSSGVVVVLMSVVVVFAWWRLSERIDPTVIVGPLGLAAVGVAAYRALQRQADERQAAVEELTRAQERLAAEERRVGALHERTRLSREIHDSVGQGLSSISLLLDAAQRAWDTAPSRAREHVSTASASARRELSEVRRVVRDLAPAGVDDAGALASALREVLDLSAPLRTELRVDGTAATLPGSVANAVIGTVRGAVANVVEHAAASTVVVTLTFHDDEVVVDIHDDGVGFDPDATVSVGVRGRGLRGIAERARELGGDSSVESVIGEGTTVSVQLPLGERR